MKVGQNVKVCFDVYLKARLGTTPNQGHAPIMSKGEIKVLTGENVVMNNTPSSSNKLQV